MIDETRILKVMEIDAKIKLLEREKENILSRVPLTTKEHYEFYHG